MKVKIHFDGKDDELDGHVEIPELSKLFTEHQIIPKRGEIVDNKKTGECFMITGVWYGYVNGENMDITIFAQPFI